MLNKEQQDQFEEMMNVAFKEQQDRLGGEPDGHTENLEITDPEMEIEDSFSDDLEKFPDSLTRTNVEPDLQGWIEHPKPEKSYELVEEPSHYDIADTSVEDIIEKLFTHEELMGWIKGNILKHRIRAGNKPGTHAAIDLDKADEYQKFYDAYKARNTA